MSTTETAAVDDRRLPGQLPATVVVTGTGGDGLGAVSAKLLAAAGTRVIGVDLAEVAEYDNYTHVRGDVTVQETWDRVLAALDAAGETGRLGLMTSAAYLEVGTVLDLDLDVWRKTYEINVIGTVLGMKALLPRMIAARDGSIVTIASIDALHAEQQLVSYCASKAAVLQLSRTAALDHARDGVNVNCVLPGPMRAGLFERHMSSAADPEQFLATRANRQPFGEIPRPEEVAKVALFLLSDAAKGMTGAQVTADAGLTTGFDFRTGAEGSSA
ncbi:SDR family NAD(P)-dependent oxidoreductase [Conexibacter arvalis]|uniref:NAD(P)-dependent dehydrogenase (Short-subunit alcohol dehydrogenase family) n=1 Tax=Conexibacter arvalis TaxID=912552 RepID=A0A840IGJ0_9ACTN|nr:SDR family oxidoreductase [Conexibacter arvalis]MBB4663194.1 NAD(P)-dependent dehydrogenase (short-subunit alcohol dehydrogenase family) [Conexibacter arvalis]